MKYIYIVRRSEPSSYEDIYFIDKLYKAQRVLNHFNKNPKHYKFSIYRITLGSWPKKVHHYD